MNISNIAKVVTPHIGYFFKGIAAIAVFATLLGIIPALLWLTVEYYKFMLPVWGILAVYVAGRSTE